MVGMNVLARLQAEAKAWVAQDLRSASVVMAHLRALILEAHTIGHSHQTIHSALQAAGLHASWNTYRSCLMRMKRAAAQPTIAPSGGMAADPSRPFVASASSPTTAPERPALRVPAVHAQEPSGTRVRDALLEAREVASRDYAQIARELRRQQQRPPLPKDLP